MINQEQKRIMHHFVNAVAKGIEMYSNRHSSYSKTMDDKEYISMIEQDYEDLWDMLLELTTSIDAQTYEKRSCVDADSNLDDIF